MPMIIGGNDVVGPDVLAEINRQRALFQQQQHEADSANQQQADRAGSAERYAIGQRQAEAARQASNADRQQALQTHANEYADQQERYRRQEEASTQDKQAALADRAQGRADTLADRAQGRSDTLADRALGRQDTLDYNTKRDKQRHEDKAERRKEILADIYQRKYDEAFQKGYPDPHAFATEAQNMYAQANPDVQILDVPPPVGGAKGDKGEDGSAPPLTSAMPPTDEGMGDMVPDMEQLDTPPPLEPDTGASQPAFNPTPEDLSGRGGERGPTGTAPADEPAPPLRADSFAYKPDGYQPPPKTDYVMTIRGLEQVPHHNTPAEVQAEEAQHRASMRKIHGEDTFDNPPPLTDPMTAGLREGFGRVGDEPFHSGDQTLFPLPHPKAQMVPPQLSAVGEQPAFSSAFEHPSFPVAKPSEPPAPSESAPPLQPQKAMTNKEYIQEQKDKKEAHERELMDIRQHDAFMREAQRREVLDRLKTNDAEKLRRDQEHDDEKKRLAEEKRNPYKRQQDYIIEKTDGMDPERAAQFAEYAEAKATGSLLPTTTNEFQNKDMQYYQELAKADVMNPRPAAYYWGHDNHAAKNEDTATAASRMAKQFRAKVPAQPAAKETAPAAAPHERDWGDAANDALAWGQTAAMATPFGAPFAAKKAYAALTTPAVAGAEPTPAQPQRAAGEVPTMTPEQAKAHPEIKRFKGTNGQIYNR